MNKNLALGATRKTAQADLIVQDGRVVKNRFGEAGAEVPIPDGYYVLLASEAA